LIKLNNSKILSILGESSIFAKISQLLGDYPWNNFLHLKVIALYEEILEHVDDKDFRQAVLFSSNIG
jgi:hypothetical protein